MDNSLFVLRVSLVISWCLFIFAFWLSLLLTGGVILKIALGSGALLIMLSTAYAVLFAVDSIAKTGFLVRSYSLHLHFLDPDSKQVAFAIRRTFRVLAANSSTYTWRFSGLTRIDAVSVKPGILTEMAHQFDEDVVVQDLGTKMSRWRICETEIHGVAEESFDENEGFWAVTVSMPTKRIEFFAQFHPDRPPYPDRVMVHESYRTSLYEIQPTSKKIGHASDGAAWVGIEIKNPRRFATYRFSWRLRKKE